MWAAALLLVAIGSEATAPPIISSPNCQLAVCVDVKGNDEGFGVGATHEAPDSSTPSRAVSAGSAFRTEAIWTPACPGNSPDGARDNTCGGAIAACPPTQPPQLLYWRWTRIIDIATGNEQRGWAQTGQTCSPFPPTEDAVTPEVTPAVVQQFFDHEPLLTSTATVQPAVRTLVQLPTIFSTTAEVQTFDEVVFGRAVHIEGTPVAYLWQFGDGQAAQTTAPGRPYPHKDITHVYKASDVTVHPSVRVTYAGRYTVEGGPWIPVPQPVAVQGPPADLRIVQARAELVSGES